MTEAKSDIAEVEYLGDLIDGRFDFSKDTLAVMAIIRKELGRAKTRILESMKSTPSVVVDPRHLTQALLDLRAVKDTFCNALIEPYAKAKSELAAEERIRRRIPEGASIGVPMKMKTDRDDDL
jgi:hypothetical protein